ncbi:hypothetical protein L2E82_17075 [Cichorium intybus]|uniref:Uncharacterized protein n=1 Tax=Cichorium intybus TaxID=13427 RepID=A0ACB9F6X5_CICIN|nr:hypothetical protein L2E82_17075 [Cichorium intybus]
MCFHLHKPQIVSQISWEFLSSSSSLWFLILSLRAQVENLEQSQAQMVENFQQQQQQMEQQMEQRLKRSQDEFEKKNGRKDAINESTWSGSFLVVCFLNK